MVNLPLDIVEHIDFLMHKIKMKLCVQEFLYYRALLLKNKKKICCFNCLYHGSPCMNCAEFLYEGFAGPGYCFGNKVLVTNTAPDVSFNMLKHALGCGTHFLNFDEESFETYLKYLPQHQVQVSD